MLSITTTKFDVENVRIEGVTCHGKLGQGSAIETSNSDTGYSPRIAGLSFRDMVVDWVGRTSADPTIRISNAIAVNSAITNVSFDNVIIVDPHGPSLLVSSTQTPIENVHWDGGVVRYNGTTASYSFPAISLDALSFATFRNISIAAGTGGPVIRVGGTSRCNDVAFTDVLIAGVLATKTGVRFDQATSCGWVRGGIAGDSSSNTTAVLFTANTFGCYVEDADLKSVGQPGSNVTFVANEGNRLLRNYGSDLRSALSFGPGVNVSINGTGTGTSIQVVSSYAVVPLTVSGNVNLYTINGGTEGALLTLVVSPSGPGMTLTAKDETLNLTADCLLSSPNDTLTLLYRGGGWVEIARSLNG